METDLGHTAWLLGPNGADASNIVHWLAGGAAVALAVADSLPDDPIAVAMSGGLDSTTVAAFAETLSPVLNPASRTAGGRPSHIPPAQCHTGEGKEPEHPRAEHRHPGPAAQRIGPGGH